MSFENPLETWTKNKVKEISVTVDKEIVHENAQEIVLDGSNSVSFPGFPYQFTAIGDNIIVSLDQFKSGYECKTCKGKGKVIRKEGREDMIETCPTCEGKTVGKGGIIIPDTAKVLASSGVVVSMGAKAQKECTEYKVGDRVLFGFHSGSMIPTKAGIMFKRMEYYQAWIRVDGAEDLGAFDFILLENEQI